MNERENERRTAALESCYERVANGERLTSDLLDGLRVIFDNPLHRGPDDAIVMRLVDEVERLRGES